MLATSNKIEAYEDSSKAKFLSKHFTKVKKPVKVLTTVVGHHSGTNNFKYSVCQEGCHGLFLRRAGDWHDLWPESAAINTD